MITYEYPFNERIRTLLRLEDLFEKTAYFAESDGQLEHHTALVTLFEILETAGRADLKMDLIQELERQRQTLLAFRNNPEISEEALSGALYEIESSSAALLAMAGKIGQYLRDNDWLMSIKSRAAIPGGVCEFDLPSYHWWLHRAPGIRREAITEWPRPPLPPVDGPGPCASPRGRVTSARCSMSSRGAPGGRPPSGAAPAAGGPRSRELTAAQKVIDQEARLTISSELGHSRGQISSVYIGR